MPKSKPSLKDILTMETVKSLGWAKWLISLHTTGTSSCSLQFFWSTFPSWLCWSGQNTLLQTWWRASWVTEYLCWSGLLSTPIYSNHSPWSPINTWVTFSASLNGAPTLYGNLMIKASWVPSLRCSASIIWKTLRRPCITQNTVWDSLVSLCSAE